MARKLIKDQKVLTQILKNDVKWTRQKIMMVAVAALIPYSGIVAYVIASGVPLGAVITLIGFPVITVISYSLIYHFTKNL